MSNYPDNFNGTNMDFRGDATDSDALDAIETVGDGIEDVILTTVDKHGLEISDQKIKDAMFAIQDALDDLFHAERHRLMRRDGWRSRKQSSSDALFNAFKSSNINEQLRQLTNPATFAAMGKPVDGE